MFRISIAAATSQCSEHGQSEGDGTYRASFKAVRSGSILGVLLDKTRPRIQCTAECPSVMLDVEVEVGPPMSIAIARHCAALAVSVAAGIAFLPVQNKLKALCLAQVPEATGKLPQAEGEGGISVSHNELRAVGVSMKSIAAHLEQYVGRIVLDETGLPGRYDITVPTDTTESARTVLRDRYGLSFQKEEREIELLLLDGREATGTAG